MLLPRQFLLLLSLFAFVAAALPAAVAQSSDLLPTTPELSPNRPPPAIPQEQAKEEWIWSRPSAGKDEAIVFRRSLSIPAGVKQANLLVTADNLLVFRINGHQVAASQNWARPVLLDVSQHLASPGSHLLEARVENKGGPAGFAMRLELLMNSGETRFIVTDHNWEWSDEHHHDQNQSDSRVARWSPVATLGPMGIQPWGDVFGKAASGDFATAVDRSKEFSLLPGFTLERVYQVPKDQGSWVALAVDGKGRLIASDQSGQLYQVTPATIGQAASRTQVQPLDFPIKGAQGLLWAHDSLYVATNSAQSAVYRITDQSGDGELDHLEKLASLRGAGEHGPHGFALSPDGEWIYLVAGNFTAVPELNSSLVPLVWDEDQLLPRRPDARGHANNTMAPGGWVVRFTPDGQHWELVSIGYRNAYGLAFNDRGDLFTYDSDMEWDFGTPWYRPTRINHVTSGSEFGWRHGTGKWPKYYEDSLPATLDIGPGSPTGVVAGKGLRFPERYQRALFVLDWTFATIYAVHLQADGASYTATTEELVSGSGLPLTDAVVGTDGALYFAVGGRNTDSSIFRVIYHGSEPTEPVAAPEESEQVVALTALRRSLEEKHRQPDPQALPEIWEALGHEDRFIRFAARVALEHLPVESWLSQLQRTDNSPWQQIHATMALARNGSTEEQVQGLVALAKIDPAALTKEPLINLMRAYGLIFARHESHASGWRESLAERFDPLYPALDDDLNRELCRFLVYLDSPEVLAKTLRLMAVARTPQAPAWAELASRNSGYGATLVRMIANMPPVQEVFYIYALRAFEGQWTEGQRRQFFTWFQEASQKAGGNSYQGFLEDLRRETLRRATEEERAMIESWALTTPSNPFADLPLVNGPGRAWSVEEAMSSAAKGLVNRDLQNGKKMYQATLCAACHRFGGEGGGAGPDLTAVGGRFAIRDLIEAIIHPENEVSDQYRFDLLTMKDGSTLQGKILEERGSVYVLATSPFDFTQTSEVPREAVKTIEPSPHSPMPGGLINRLNEDELRDLLAFLLQSS